MFVYSFCMQFSFSLFKLLVSFVNMSQFIIEVCVCVAAIALLCKDLLSSLSLRCSRQAPRSARSTRSTRRTTRTYRMTLGDLISWRNRPARLVIRTQSLAPVSQSLQRLLTAVLCCDVDDIRRSKRDIWPPSFDRGTFGRQTTDRATFDRRLIDRRDIRPPPDSLQLCMPASLRGSVACSQDNSEGARPGRLHEPLIAGHQTPRKRRKYTQADQTIETIVSEYANRSKVDYLRGLAGSQRWNELMNMLRLWNDFTFCGFDFLYSWTLEQCYVRFYGSTAFTFLEKFYVNKTSFIWNTGCG